MIKITYLTGNIATICLEVDSIRVHQIWESTIGMTIAKKSPAEYHIKGEKIYRIKKDVPVDYSILKLKEMKTEAQVEFSDKIRIYRNRIEELKLLQEIIKKERVKK